MVPTTTKHDAFLRNRAPLQFSLRESVIHGGIGAVMVGRMKLFRGVFGMRGRTNKKSVFLFHINYYYYYFILAEDDKHDDDPGELFLRIFVF